MFIGRSFLQSEALRVSRVTSLLAFFLPIVSSRFFSAFSGGVPCIFIDVDFTVQITANYHGNTIAERIFTANEVVDTNYNCEDVPRYIELNFESSSTNLKFSFKLSDDDDKYRVKLSRTFTLKPSYIFPRLEAEVGSVCFKRSSKNTGNDTSSYLCSKKKRTNYDVAPCEGGLVPLTNSKYTYAVKVDMKTIHTQAYNIKRNVFSPPKICEESDHDRTTVIIGSVLGAIFLVVVVVVVVGAFILVRRKRASSHQSNPSHVQHPSERSSLLGNSQPSA